MPQIKLSKFKRLVLPIIALTVLVATTGAIMYTRNFKKLAHSTVTQPSPSPSTSDSPDAALPSPTPSASVVPTPTSSATPTPTPSKYFTLAGEATASGVQLDWDVAGYDVNQGFKLALDNSETGSFSNFKYLSNSTVRSALWKVGDGQTRYFKVCGYHKDSGNAVSGTTGCSNIVAINTNNVAAETSGSISLLPSTSNGGFHWTIEGYAPYGFRLVWASHTNPVYPTDQSQSYPAVWSNAGSGSIPNAPGTWYVKACMVTSSQGCSNYSDEKVITIQ